MFNVAVDTSILIAVVTNEPSKDQLVHMTDGYDLIAPYSIHWEIGNAFSAMLNRRRIGVTEALQAITAFQTIPIRFVEIELDEAIKIANSLDIYAYDAYLLQCALKYNVPLLTLDKGLMNAAMRVGIPVWEVTE